MIAKRIVRRYAAALFRAAERSGLVDVVESDLGLVSYAFETSSRLRDAVCSPVVTPEVKRRIIQDLFADKVQQITLDYLNLLIAQRREEAILQTEREFVAFANEFRGVVDAEIITAVELPPELEQRLVDKLEAVFGRTVKARKSIEPDIVAGVIVRIGDRVIDGSIEGSLAALKEKLSE